MLLAIDRQNSDEIVRDHAARGCSQIPRRTLDLPSVTVVEVEFRAWYQTCSPTPHVLLGRTFQSSAPDGMRTPAINSPDAGSPSLLVAGLPALLLGGIDAACRLIRVSTTLRDGVSH
jgi:hypothetical protein